MKVIRSIVVAVGLSMIAGAASAGPAVEQLKKFGTSAKSAQGSFEQTVADGKKLKRSSGTFSFSRPGKFRWEYAAPYKQTIVGDGQKLWIWDPDLNQVTERKIGNALGSTPAAILFGESNFEKDFNLFESKALPGDGAEGAKLGWVEARPKKKSGDDSLGFQLIRFGFDKDRLARLVMLDNFNQTTTVYFSSLQLNTKIDAGVYRFKAPKGAEILVESSGQ